MLDPAQQLSAECAIENNADLNDSATDIRIENSDSNPAADFASDILHDDPGRIVHWADSGKSGIGTKWWKPYSGNCAEEHRYYFAPKPQKTKDERAYFPGKLSGDACTAANVEFIEHVIADVDATDEEEINRVIAAIQEAELGVHVYSTFSHGALDTEVRQDDWDAFCREQRFDVTSAEAARRYLAEVLEYRADISKDATVKDRFVQSQEGLGTVTLLGHAPLIKLRFVFTLDEPYVPAQMCRRGFTNSDARGRVWNAAQTVLFEALGIPFDRSTTKDVSRRFYAAAARPGTDNVVCQTIPGKAVSLAAILPKSTEELDRIIPSKAADKTKAGAKPKVNPNKARTAADEFTFEGFRLEVWAAQYARGFQIAEVCRARGLVAEDRSNGGCFVKCFQEDRHSSANPSRTWAVDGDSNQGFVLHCSGATGGCCDLDRLIRLKHYLECGLITLDDLQNPEYGGGPISARVQYEHGRARRRDTTAVDSNGRALDVAVYHASMIAKPGLLDFDKLSRLTGKQIAPDLTAEQLTGFLEAGQVTVDQLIACTILGPASGEQESDPYARALAELARRSVDEKLLARTVSDELDTLAAKYKVKPADIQTDFKRIAKAIPDPETMTPGVLSADDSALVRPLRAYSDRFAILGMGGNGYILDMFEPNISRATMTTVGFELLYRNEWFTNAAGQTVYPAICFLGKPPRSAQVYRGGLVFEPTGTVGSDQYNLYKGLLIEPDASGAYDLFQELIRDVWAHGDEAAYQWIMEWFLHIAAYPGEKVSTSIAIRGDYGDGKSFPTERLLSTILGDMLLRVADQKAVLGDFNEALIGKMLIVLEEAAFAGDKQLFDRLKELVTGPTVSINQKHKARFTVANHARMMLISNHEHFMHIKTGDRRYAVLESSSAWNGNRKKFEQTLEQWNKGGAARFVHDAHNHSFRRFDDSRQLVINTNLKTDAAVDQMALSRSPLEKAVVSFLLRGAFTSPKDRMVILQEPDGNSARTLRWQLDEPLSIPSNDLQDAITIWLREFDSRAAQYEASPI